MDCYKRPRAGIGGFLSLLILYSANLQAATPWTGVLAPNRAMDWSSAGIPGGIPSGSWTQCGPTITVASNPTSATIADALSHNTITHNTSGPYANCGANTYVLLGPGTFNLSGAIRVVGMSNVELRGSGPTQTKLHFSGGSTCSGGSGSCLIGFESSDNAYADAGTSFYNWTSGYAKGATSITLSSGANLKANSTMLVLDQCDTGFSGQPCAGAATDNGNFFSCEDGYSGGTGCSYHGSVNSARPHRAQQEMVEVTSCSPACGSSGATTVTITPPLQHPNWSGGQTPETWIIQSARYVGVRNLLVDATGTTYDSVTAAIAFNNDAYYWVQNVAIENTPNIALYIRQSIHGDIESNYIYNAGQSNPTTDNSGINWYGSNNLITNNIVHNGHLAMIANGSVSGNVLSYNYLVNSFTGNATLFGTIWPGHSNGADYNLYEGNVAAMYDIDNAHGVQLMDTLYRNFLPGWESCANGQCGSDAFKTSDLFAVIDTAFSRYGNYVGNVLGTPGISTLGYNFTSGMYFFSSGAGKGYPWNLGSGNANGPPEYNGPIPIDPLVATTALRWGNWDAFNGSTQWNTSEVPSGLSVYPNPVPSGCSSSGSCPASFYLSAKPAWWKAGIPFPAIGPDVTGGNVGQVGGTINTHGHQSGTAALIGSNFAGDSTTSAWGGHLNAIPAMDCYLRTLNGLPDGTGTALNFDGTNCYGALGTTPPPPPPPPANSCDLNNDGSVNSADVQSSVNQVLGLQPCTTADFQQTGQCTAVDVQRVVNAVLGGSCVVGP